MGSSVMRVLECHTGTLLSSFRSSFVSAPTANQFVLACSRSGIMLLALLP